MWIKDSHDRVYCSQCRTENNKEPSAPKGDAVKKKQKKKLLAAQNKAACKRALLLVRGLFKTAQSKKCLRQAWRLVTALRGEDGGCKEGKRGTCTVLRGALIGKVQAVELHLADKRIYQVSPKWQPRRLDIQVCGTEHYAGHVKMARDILNSASK